MPSNRLMLACVLACLQAGVALAQDGQSLARAKRDAYEPLRVIIEAGKLKPRHKAAEAASAAKVAADARIARASIVKPAAPATGAAPDAVPAPVTEPAPMPPQSPPLVAEPPPSVPQQPADDVEAALPDRPIAVAKLHAVHLAVWLQE